MKNTLLLFLVIQSCLFGSGTAAGAQEPNNTRPNIIFILTDDHRFDAMGYAGNTMIRTPAMDQLAREGSYFHHAMVTTPICAASRASILTGLYERTHGYTFEAGNLQPAYQQISYPLILKASGYYTGFFGKLGVDMRNPQDLFDTSDFYDRNVGYKDYRGYFYKTIGSDTVHLTRYTGYQAEAFLNNTPTDKPFCLSLNFSAPHAHDVAPDQYFWTKKYDTLFDAETIPPPQMGDDRFFNRLPAAVQQGFNRTRWLWRFDSPDKYQRMVKGYYRMITEVDDEIQRIRELLQQRGLDKNTVIIVMGDNGYYLGERQLADKWLMYDLSLRVPLIIYDPRVKRHFDIDDIVLNIDIPKTILTLAHSQVPAKYQGISLSSYIKKGADKVQKRNVALFEHLWNKKEIPSSEGVRTDRWKYFRYRFIQADEELYDLVKDPMEQYNLARDKAYKDTLERLRGQCNELIKKYAASGSLPVRR